MTFENGSASANERTIACPASLALPRVHRAESKYTAKGHTIHDYIRAVGTGTAQDVALAQVDEEHRATCRMLDWKKLVGDLQDLEFEAAYAFDVRARTARLLGHNLRRNYPPLGPWEVPGSLDIAGLRKKDLCPAVIDGKTGYQDVTAPAENGQGLFFGAVKRALLGASEVEFRIAKIKPGGDVWVETATYTSWEIDTYLDELEVALERSKAARKVYLAGGVPEVAEGPWCGYCEAQDHCPAKTRLARSMLGVLDDLEPKIAAMTLAQKGAAFEIVHERILPLAMRVETLLKESARSEPLPLSGDRQLMEAPYEKRNPHFESALNLARELGATELQLKACYRDITIRPIVARKIAKPKAKARR